MQIQEILESRIKDTFIFDGRSITLISKKVAQYTGDIRRALQVTKRAVEIVRDEYVTTGKQRNVDNDDVLDAFEEMSNSKTVHVLKGLRKFEIIVIIAIFLELKQKRVDKILMDCVQQRCEDIIQRMKAGGSLLDTIDEKKEIRKYQNWHLSILTTTMFREIVKRLQAFGLINLTVESSKITDN